MISIIPEILLLWYSMNSGILNSMVFQKYGIIPEKKLRPILFWQWKESIHHVQNNCSRAYSQIDNLKNCSSEGAED